MCIKHNMYMHNTLNGGASGGLERGRSEVSSIVSEVPDYLFGLDSSDDPPVVLSKIRHRSGLSEPVPGSAPGSPAFGSASSAPPMPNLPPVKTKPEKTNLNPVEDGGSGGSSWGQSVNPGSPYPAHAVQQQIPVYYVPAAGGGPGMVAHRNVVPVPVQVPIPGPYVAQYGPGPVQVPIGYPGPGVGPMYEMPMQGNMVQGQNQMNMNQNQPIYYGIKNGGMVAAYPGTGLPVSGDEDGSRGRTFQS